MIPSGVPVLTQSSAPPTQSTAFIASTSVAGTLLFLIVSFFLLRCFVRRRRRRVQLRDREHLPDLTTSFISDSSSFEEQCARLPTPLLLPSLQSISVSDSTQVR